MTVRYLLRRSKSDTQEHSIDVQREVCAALAATRGFKGEAVEYVSDGISGDDIEGLRALRDLVNDARRGDTVICREHSRLGRDMLESAVTIRQLVADKGARLFYSSTGEEVLWRNAADAFMSVARGFGAQSELEAIRSRTREALRSRVKAGHLAGGSCYGYDLRRVAEGDREYTIAVVNESQAAVIRRIFAEYLAGAGFKAIAIRLNDEGVPSPVAKRRGSGSWSPGQIRCILRRERYRGWYIHGQVDRVRKNGKRVVRKADEAQILRIEIPEWRIVDDLTWQRAQAMAAQRAPSTKSDNRAVYALSGIARCVCGGSIGVTRTKTTKGVKLRAYGCVRHHTRGSRVCPVSVRRPVGVVEDGLADALKVALERPEVVEAILTALRAEIQAEALAAGRIDVGALQAELIEVRREHRNLIRLAARLDEPDPEIDSELKARSRRLSEIERSLRVATSAPLEAAGILANAEGAVRGQLADLRAALGADPTATRDFYRGLFTAEGLTFTPDTSQRPARWIVTGAVDLSKGQATPAGFEPASSA